MVDAPVLAISPGFIVFLIIVLLFMTYKWLNGFIESIFFMLDVNILIDIVGITKKKRKIEYVVGKHIPLKERRMG